MNYRVGGWMVGEWMEKQMSKWRDRLVEGR